MLVFYDPGIRNFSLSIVNDSIPLVIGDVQYFLFKLQASVFQFAETIIKILVDRSCINNFVCTIRKFIPVLIVIYIAFYFCSGE